MTANPTDVLAHAEAAAGEQTRRLQEREIERLAFVSTAGTPDGRRFIRCVLAQTGIGESAFNTNALAMARATGRQDIGHWLTNQLRSLCPHLLVQLQKEMA